jgi:phosphatidylethanolamine N-methyltransferase
VVVFLFWRLAYNLGLGVILYQQSNHNWFAKLVTLKKEDPRREKLKNLLGSMMEDDYDFDVCRHRLNSFSPSAESPSRI